MAGLRGVQLTRLSCAGTEDLDPEDTDPDLDQDQSPTQPRGSVRLVLQLLESNEGKFPEFNYKQVLQDQSDGPRRGEQSVAEEPETGENDEVTARRFEEQSGDRRKKDRMEDLMDLGLGYDNEDSFIDNSEAYDEFVPASITTELGGFYVNCGVLQYRQASDAETEKETPLLTDTVCKLSGGRDKPKTTRQRAGGQKTSSADPICRDGLDPENETKTKRRKTLSVTRMLRKLEREKERESRNEAAAVDAAGGGCPSPADPRLDLFGLADRDLIQAVGTVDLDVDLQSLLDIREEAAVETGVDDQSRPGNFPNAALKNLTLGRQPSPECFPPVSGPSTQLPDGLPAALEQSIRRLAAAAKTSEGGSKLKFFSPEMNCILLDIELQCRQQAGPLRSKVYTHLSSFLPCSRDTLLKRAKRLVVTHTEGDAVETLRDAIQRSMVEQTAGLGQRCQVYGDVRTSRVEEKGGTQAPPKKVFRWNQEIRECLGLVLNRKILESKKERKGLEMEEYLKTLLDQELKPLWPKGWMPSRVLLNESRKLLGLVPPLPIRRTRAAKRPSKLSEGLAVAPPSPREDRGAVKATALTLSHATDSSSAPAAPGGGAGVCSGLEALEPHIISDDDCVVIQ